MDCPDVITVLRALFDRGTCTLSEADFFADRKHAELVETLFAYLNCHRHFFGMCQIDDTQALNDRGVDVLLVTGGVKVGFQIKSHFDVKEKDFAAKVKRQFAESLVHELDCYFVLICAPLKDSTKDHTQKITHLGNELRRIGNGLCRKGIQTIIMGPRATGALFRNPLEVTRDELLSKKAIAESCLHHYERGFEHLPEPRDPEIDAAVVQFDSNYGELWWDTGGEEAKNAHRKLMELWERKAAERFTTEVLPTFPLRIQQQRSELITAIHNTLAELREFESCDEDRWPPWLEYVEEAMIPFTSLPNLLKIQENVTELLLRLRCAEREPRQLRLMTCADDGLGFFESCNNHFDYL